MFLLHASRAVSWGGPDFICRMPGWGEKTKEHSHQLALGGMPAPFLASFARLLTHHTLHI